MKSIKYSLIVFFVLFLTVNTMQAQDKRTLDTKIADLLAQMPANDTKQLNKQMNNLLKLGEEGQQKILFMVIPPGTGDDTKARFAVEGMSRFLSRLENFLWDIGCASRSGSSTTSAALSFEAGIAFI